MPRTRLIITMLLLVMFSLPAYSQTLIANPEQQATQLSRTTIRAMFAMRTQQWPDGTSIKVFVFADSQPLHVSFCKSILGMFPYQLRRIWDRQIFSGTGIEPITVTSEQEMLDMVSQTKGAIGYIETVPEHSSVTILETVQ